MGNRRIEISYLLIILAETFADDDDDLNHDWVYQLI